MCDCKDKLKTLQEHGRTTVGTAPPALQATPVEGVRHEAFPLLDLAGCAQCATAARDHQPNSRDTADSVRGSTTEEAVMYSDFDAEASF
jgi:hypothetical protein